jgi:hypothetical protein
MSRNGVIRHRPGSAMDQKNRLGRHCILKCTGEQGSMPSSVIAAMQYDEDAQTLTIVFRGKRGVYRYYEVDPEEYAEFLSAPSKGTYLNHTFKARQHPYKHLDSSQFIHLVDKT